MKVGLVAGREVIIVVGRELVVGRGRVKGAELLVLRLDAKVFPLHDDVNHRDVDGPEAVGEDDGEDDIDGVVETGGDDKVEADADVEVREVGDPLVLAVQTPLNGARYPTN